MMSTAVQMSVVDARRRAVSFMVAVAVDVVLGDRKVERLVGEMRAVMLLNNYGCSGCWYL